MSAVKVSLAPASPDDYAAIAHLEAVAFEPEPFDIIAFGPYRLTEAAKNKEAARLAELPKPGEMRHYVKATIISPDEVEEIVGFANWTVCIGRKGSGEEKLRLGSKEGWVVEEKEKEAESAEADEEGHGDGRLRKAVLAKVDELQAKATDGRDYMTLNMLVVSPKCQRMGIGKTLFENGIEIADRSCLQLVLWASIQGAGLYKKYGCVEVEIIDFDLNEYKGGEGMANFRSAILRRPVAVSVRN